MFKVYAVVFLPKSLYTLTRLLHKDWKTIDLKTLIHRLAARVSCRVFLGPELSDNAEWIDIDVTYTENSMRVIYQLRSLHPIFRPIAQWWMPALRVCRLQVAKSREIINPLVQKRLQKKANGEATEKTADIISWIDDKARAKKTKIDFAELQLFLSFAAVHTTTEMISGLMCDLVENEHWISQIREEVVSTLSKYGRKRRCWLR